MKRISNSKKYAWAVLCITTILTAYAISKGLEGAVMAMYSSGIVAGAGLYANKQHVDLKQQNIEKGNSNG